MLAVFDQVVDNNGKVNKPMSSQYVSELKDINPPRNENSLLLFLV